MAIIRGHLIGARKCGGSDRYGYWKVTAAMVKEMNPVLLSWLAERVARPCARLGQG
jgi:hypothetical protein